MIADGLRKLIESAADGYFVHDAEGRILDVNQRSCSDLGRTREELLGLTINDISCGSTPTENLRNWANAPAGAARTFREIAVRKDGSAFPVQISVNCEIIDGRKLFLGLARDISGQEADRAAIEDLNRTLEARVEERTGELRESEHRVAQQYARLVQAARLGGLGVWVYDMVRDVLDCDEQWYRIMGRDPARPIRSIGEFRPFIHPDDAARATEVDEAVARLMSADEDYFIIFRIVRPDGVVRWIRSSAKLLTDVHGAAAEAVGFVVDITESREAEAELEKQAMEDPLTGIANRRRLDVELERACRQAMRDGRPLALAMIDVDFFKGYNDHYGHTQGDAALCAVARILSSVARRPYDLAARYGGEEFVLLLPGLEQPQQLFETISGALEKLRLLNARSPIAEHLTVSCGCALASAPESLSPETLLTQSDRALYRAKEGGRNRLVVVEV